MTEEKRLGGLDCFKLAAAFLVVSIHTSPLASFRAEWDFVLTRVIARVAVPYFLMVTGYFLLPQYVFGRSMDDRPLRRCLKKLFFLYLAGIMLYLPVNLYAGQFKGLGIVAFLRMVLIDGTFYHLWYLPAAVLGAAIVWFLGRKMSFGVLLGICFGLYLIGLSGDSYYGLAGQVPALKRIYEGVFLISSYTRNGLFYAPLFLAMGAGIYEKRHIRNKIYFYGKEDRNGRRDVSIKNTADRKAFHVAGFAISMGLMTLEGLSLHRLDLQRHDSMYIMLPVVMYFLFQVLLAKDAAPVKRFREISMWIYLIHPLCIILVRGGAKAVHLEGLLVENSLVHYLAVCVLSGAGAVTGSLIFARIAFFRGKKQASGKGRAWIELSRENLARNVETLCGLLKSEDYGAAEPKMSEQPVHGKKAPAGDAAKGSVSGQLMPAVKANAYGHGAVLMAEELQKMGIEAFCAACAAEGVELRKNGITGEILVLGYTHPKDFGLLKKYRLTQTVVDLAYAKALHRYSKKIRVHVKIDTGMHRLGERAENGKEISKIFRLKNLQVEGIYTHLCADETRDAAERAYTERQAELFYAAAERLKEQGFNGFKTHLLASYGLLNYPELGGDYVRVGIALYGVLSDRKTVENCPVKLAPVLSLKARIAAVKNLYRGESVGYGLEYKADTDRKIAVLSAGYADGLPRSLSDGRGRVLIHGKSAPVIGRICMDQTIVDVTGIEGVKAGESAVLIGRSGQEEITAYELAEQAGTITNEILSRLGERLGRILV